MLEALALQWKRQIIVRDASLQILTASASYASLEEWERIRNSLTTAPLVQGLEVMGISSDGAELRISYKGGVDLLTLTLAQRNVSLSNVAAAAVDPMVMETNIGTAPGAAIMPAWRLSVAP